MILSINNRQLTSYVYKQICMFFPDEIKNDLPNIEKCVDIALDRVDYCFKSINVAYYCNENKESLFNHLNGDHYAHFLYFLSNSIWTETKDEKLSSKIFLLNKALHGLDLFYARTMPDIFLLVHPIGTIIGKASFSNYLTIYQGCTIGASDSHNSSVPKIGEHVTMFSNSSLLGNCKIGRNVVIGANSYLINTSIKDDKIATGQYPNIKISPNKSGKRFFF